METDKVSILWPKGGRDVGKAISVRAAYAFGDWPPVETPAQRLEALRSALEAEDISMGELIELADLAEYIDPSDVQLLEAAGVPEQDYMDGNTPKQVAERGYRIEEAN